MDGKVPLWWLRHQSKQNANWRPGFSGSGLKNYELMKKAWITANPEASPEAYQRAMDQIAREVGV